MIDLHPITCNLCGGKVVYTSNAAIYGRSCGSGMGKTNESLAPSCPGAKLLDGRILNEGMSNTELAEWAENFE